MAASARRWRRVWLAGWLVLPAVAPAAASVAASVVPGEWTQELRGTIGPYRVGGALIVRDGRAFEAGHYFYASRLTDIPLVGSMRNGELELREPGGGEFRLRAVRNDGAAVPDLADATRLDGSWTANGRTLPVRLEFDWGQPGPWPARRYAEVTALPDAAFEARVRGFVDDVLADRRDAAAGFVVLPLSVNGVRPFTVRTRADLLARWDAVFTPAVVAALRTAIPHEMFVRDGRAMLGDGQVWFDGRGVMAVNVG